MSNINTVYSYFDTYNHTEVLATSGYALPFTPFTFTPRLDNVISSLFSVKRIVWDYGDGTVSESVTGRHAFSQPGNYRVSCTLYDVNGNSYFNTFQQSVDVYDFVPNTLLISVPGPDYTLVAGQIASPIYVTNSLSYRVLSSATDNKSIIPACSGISNDYFVNGFDSMPYSHLYSYSSFYELEVSLNQSTEFVEVKSFQTNTTPLYCKLSGTSVVYTNSTDADSFFCGLTGHKDIYFKDDIPSPLVNLFFGYEPGALLEFANSSTVGLSASITPNTSYSKLVINANGVTSEGDTSDLFNINKNKFAHTKIGFVVKIKDSLNFTNKLSSFTISSFNSMIQPGDPLQVVLTNGTTVFQSVSFYSNYNDLSAIPVGSFKGYFIADLPYTSGVYLSAHLAGVTLDGVSTPFDIYPTNYYNIAKRGEDIDMTQRYKDIAMQPLFLDNKILFDDFINSAVGDLSSNIGDALGKRVYEKTQNFVDNNASVDYASVHSLVSINQMIGNANIQFDRSDYLFPADLGRLIDTCSINFSRLTGNIDTFDQDYKTYGYQSRDTYGTNLGSEVTSLNYTVTAGTNLVAFEKYSGKFSYLNTYLPLCATIYSGTSSTYKLSSYNNTWGWGLVLGDHATTQEIINEFYLFYEHNPILPSGTTNSVINYDDITNTITQSITSYTDWSKEDGIISNMLANQLYTGLDLFQP